MWGRLIYKYNTIILVVIFILSGISVALFPRLKTEVSFKQFFPKGEPALAQYESFVRTMGSSENTMVLAIAHEPSIFDTTFLHHLQNFHQKLVELPHVIKVTSILSLKQPSVPLPFLVPSKYYLKASQPEDYKEDSTRIFRDFLITQHFIKRDAKVVKLVLQLSDSLSLNATDSLIQRIDTAATMASIQETHFLGRKYMESEYNKIMKHEMLISMVLSFAFVLILLILLHQSFAGVVFPLLCVSISLVMMYGYMALFQRPLTIMSNLFPTIILIVGISDVMHISSKFAYETLNHSDPVTAINKTIKEIGFTTFLNSFTTAIGFLTLLTMSMVALQNFGVDAAVGLLITWVNSILLLPALLLRCKVTTSLSRSLESGWWTRFMDNIMRITTDHAKPIVFTTVLLLGLSIVGLFFLNTNNFMLTGLPKNNRLQSDFAFFEQQLGGGRSFELLLHAKNNNRLSHQDVIQNIEKLETYLQTNAGVSEIVSPVSLVKWMNQAVHPIAGWQLPGSQVQYDQLFSMNKNHGDRLPLSVIDTGDTLGRLYGRIEDIGRKKIEMVYSDMQQWIIANIDTSLIQCDVTGPDYMTDVGHRLRIENMTWSFCMEIVIVSLIIGLIYRSRLMVLVTFISSIVPIILIGGLMGYLGIELRGSTTIIFAIGYVIVVDDTLHVINRFQLERKRGLTVQEAIHQTFRYSVRAVVMTSLILLGGFMILMTSSFGDIFMLGFLVSLIVFFGMVTELFLVPVLIGYLFSRQERRREKKLVPIPSIIYSEQIINPKK